MAAQIETDPAFFAALSAKETETKSGYGTSYAFRHKHNLFGASKKEVPIRYRSYQKSADSWLRMFGGDVWGAPSMDDFIDGLQSVGRYQRPYNSKDKSYFDGLAKKYDDVKRWAGICGVDL